MAVQLQAGALTRLIPEQCDRAAQHLDFLGLISFQVGTALIDLLLPLAAWKLAGHPVCNEVDGRRGDHSLRPPAICLDLDVALSAAALTQRTGSQQYSSASHFNSHQNDQDQGIARGRGALALGTLSSFIDVAPHPELVGKFGKLLCTTRAELCRSPRQREANSSPCHPKTLVDVPSALRPLATAVLCSRAGRGSCEPATASHQAVNGTLGTVEIQGHEALG
eukprot:1160217-Pelagomonas_calceolata.AAC.3